MSGQILRGVRVVKTNRLNNSADGNPRYGVVFDDGTVVETEADAQINYGITNREFRDEPHDAELTRAGRLAYLRPSAGPR